MTKIDIVSGFLGAGKTTLIKKMVKEAYQDVYKRQGPAPAWCFCFVGGLHGLS